jgi:predicted transcriptional regulator
MSKTAPQSQLSRRERQIMDVVYRLGKSSVTDVLERLPDPPSYSAVRALMRILGSRGT